MKQYVGIILCFFISVGCGKFTYSYYLNNPKKLLLNKNGVHRIVHQIVPQRISGDSFKIAVTADTHDYYNKLDVLIDTLNKKSHEYAFLVIAGDITNMGLLAEFELVIKFLSRLKIPWISTIGNHDLLNFGQVNYSLLFGSSNYSFNFKNVKFVLFNNNNWETHGELPDPDWIIRQLEKDVQKMNVLVSHVPPNDSDRFSKEKIRKWEDMIRNYDVDIYLSGHNHNFGDSMFGETPLITIGSPVKGKYLELHFHTEVDYAFINF